MTTILPAWKLELIEKKKKKEQDHRQKVEEEKTRKVSIPEWKRSLLEKKKEAASDLPETKEQGLCFNSVFGPRIVRKASQTSQLNASLNQKPVGKGDYEENKRNISQDINTAGRTGPLYSSPADTNSCVTKAVEIPTEVERKPNKLNTQREIEDKRESSRSSDVTTAGKDFKMVVDVQETEQQLDNEPSKTPSVLSFRRMFEQSKPQASKEPSDLRISKTTESKVREQNDKRTTESTLGSVASESQPASSQLQISNKSSVDKGYSIYPEKSTRPNADSSEQKVPAPKPSFAPKPYKSFVSTPPWLKNTAPRNVAFQTGSNKFVQENKVVPKVNSELQSAPKDFDTLDQKNVVVIESASKEKSRSDIESDTKQRISLSNRSDTVEPSFYDVQKSTEKTVLPQEPIVQKYSIVKGTDSKEEQVSTKSDKGNENQKYTIVIDSRSQQEVISTSEKDRTLANATTDSVSNVPNDDVGDNEPYPSSIQSLRSKFGSVGGFRRRTSSEENLFLKSNQAEPSGQVNVIRRSAELKRPPAPMKRWTADVLSLMSQPLDDNDTTSNLPPRNDAKNVAPTTNQLKRPPPPTKRWTADVITVMSQQTDDSSSNFSPRSDSSKKSISPSNSLNRGRSSSLVDIREEVGVQDYFQHKPSVSHGIEHRVSKLIRRMSISETQLNVEGEESDSTSEDDTNDPFLDLKIAANKEKDVQSPPPEPDVKPVFKRKHSISSDIDHRVSELFHRQLSQPSDTEESEGEKSTENDTKTTVVQIVDDVKEPVMENLKIESVSLVNAEVPFEFASSTKDAPKEDVDDFVQESKPVSGSVHKLSALFGSSILKPKKKDKNVAEEKPKDKASKQQKISSTEKSNSKSSSVEKDENRKSSLFSKSHKSEAKSGQKDKQQSNTSIFPWLKKHDKERDNTGGNKAKEIVDKNQKNSISFSDADNLPASALGLQPVRKPVKVEQRLVGNVKIISNASHEPTPPKGVYHKTKPSVQISEPEKQKIPAKVVNNFKTDNRKTEPQIPSIVTQYWNGNQKSASESVPVTSIDEVPVSAIDIPESPESDVTVSVIDVPVSPDVRSTGKFSFLNGHKEDDDVTVSVIDLPSPRGREKSETFGYLEADELSDGSDADEIEGSYDFATGKISNQVNGDVTGDDDDDEEEEEEEDEEEEDEDEDDEDVPISYIGAAAQYAVPQVVFDSEPVQLKSCLSPKTERKKVNRGRVSFKSSHMVHGYPSEEAVTAVYDEHEKNNNAEQKTLQNYQPASLVNMEKKFGYVGGHQQFLKTKPQPVSNGDNKPPETASKGHPEIKYADEGQGFTDATDSASALLF